MRWIDFESKKPTDTFQGWEAWSDEKWQAWLDESKRLLKKITALNDESKVLYLSGLEQDSVNKIEERNKVIDNNSRHWGKLKPWLFALSNGKCWFTEGRDICSHMDVEHFRPKKIATDLAGSERDGYWWLAFDYSNYRAAGNVPNRKKGGWFPLHKDSPCSRVDAQCEESETPFLLDPIIKYDTDLLAFNEEGNAIPSPDADEWEKERVEVSIERLKLNAHDALPQERRRIWQEVSTAIEVYLDANPNTSPGLIPYSRKKWRCRLERYTK